jgi:3-phenylpropionate/trans-cinnamate dioxygenase ferredoxin reductase subunit
MTETDAPTAAPHAADVTIVGAGVGGVRTAQSLRRHGYDGSITLFGAERHLPYDRPPLSKKIITGETQLHEIHLCDSDQLRDLHVEYRAHSPVARLDTQAQTLVFVSGEVVPYRRLVIASGATPKVLPGAATLKNVFVLRTVDDALHLRNAAMTARQACVVGGGVLGAEIAASLRFHGLEVSIVEAAPGLLARSLGESAVASKLLSLHTEAGVEVRLNVGVSGLRGETSVIGVDLTDGSRVPADLVVIALGVRPETEWLADSGLEIDDGVVCDLHLQTSARGVFAVGDVVQMVDAAHGTRHRAEHWTSAVEQADVVARNLIAGDEGELTTHVPAPYVWSDQYSERIQTIGTTAGADLEEVIAHPDHTGRLLCLFSTDGVFTGAAAIGMPRPITRLRPMLANGAPYESVLELARTFG